VLLLQGTYQQYVAITVRVRYNSQKSHFGKYLVQTVAYLTSLVRAVGYSFLCAVMCSATCHKLLNKMQDVATTTRRQEKMPPPSVAVIPSSLLCSDSKRTKQ
jgi:hypothetical protein